MFCLDHLISPLENHIVIHTILASGTGFIYSGDFRGRIHGMST